jgi:prolyl oligopeptidase
MDRRALVAPLALFALHCGSNPPPIPPAPALTPSPSASTGPAATLAPAIAPPPVTAKHPVTDEYWSQKVVDDYRWLENASDPDVKAWSAEQNAYARKFLDATPHYADVRARVAAILGQESADFIASFANRSPAAERLPALAVRGDTIFAMKDEPPKQQPFLVTMKSPAKPEEARVLVDPNAIDTTGGTTIDWFVPSRDGKLVAVSMSQGGSENGSVHVFDVATGKEKGDVIAHAHGGTAGGSLAWNASGSGFYYTRYPRPGERPAEDLDFYQQIYFHKLGAKPESDTYSLGKDFPRIAEVAMESSSDGKYVLAQIQNGDGREFLYYVLGPGGAWTKFADYKDKIAGATLGHDGDIFAVSHAGAPRGKVLRLRAAKPDLASAEVIVPEGAGSIEDIAVSQTKLWVKSLAGGPSALDAYPLQANSKSGVQSVAIPPVSQVSAIVPLHGDEILFRDESFVLPPAWYQYKLGDAAGPTKTGMAVTSPADFSDSDVTVASCTSKDGTHVPISILRQKSAPKPGPTVLYGYGGYGVNQEPRFRPQWRTWIEQGGTYALANIRGGAELGESWHEQGKLTNKQNVFDDFAACAQLLLGEYTTKEKLAIMGGSNGGLLMGAEMTQHPEMFRAVVSLVGIYDMLRVELAPNGAFNVTEFGSVKDKSQFDALFAYSPYHHVKDGAAYPAVLMMTGANDPRVDPYHSRKMVARLQSASASGQPILLRTSGSTGHGIGTPLGESIAQQADLFAFLITELGVAYTPVR